MLHFSTTTSEAQPPETVKVSSGSPFSLYIDGVIKIPFVDAKLVNAAQCKMRHQHFVSFSRK